MKQWNQVAKNEILDTVIASWSQTKRNINTQDTFQCDLGFTRGPFY